MLNYSYFETEFPETFRTAYQIRDEIGEDCGWNKVVAFQTRNPMHRAHEELCRMAHEALGTDGILIHMLLGKLKPGDIPADVRDNCIRTMVEHYFPPNTVMITGYGFDMLYAGPREAVLHAVFRQNCGCTPPDRRSRPRRRGRLLRRLRRPGDLPQEVPEGALRHRRSSRPITRPTRRSSAR